MNKRTLFLLFIFFSLLVYFLVFSIRSPFKNTLFPIIYSKTAREILPNPKPSPNTHSIILTAGSNVHGEILKEDDTSITLRKHNNNGSYTDEVIKRSDIFEIDINTQAFMVSSSEIIAKRMFPSMNFYRFENYTIFNDSGYSSVGSTAGILKTLYTNIKKTFPDIVAFDEQSNRICVVVFNNTADYQKLISKVNNSFSESIGFYSPDHNILFVNNDFDVRRKMSYPNDIVRHEGAHQIFYAARLHFGYNVDRLWLVEGIAVYSEGVRIGQLTIPRRDRVKQMIQQNKMMKLTKLLGKKFLGKSSKASDFYDQSWAFVFFLMSEYRDGFTDYLLYVKNNPLISFVKGDKKLIKEFINPDLNLLETEFKTFWLKS